MNKKELKYLIKEMVRESLTEIFAEMKLESIVEGVMKKQTRPSSRLNEEVQERPAPVRQPIQRPKPAVAIKEQVIKNLGVTDDEWSSIYADIDTSKLPPGMGSSGGHENPELVTEGQLEQLGLMRDYSEFLK